MTNRNSLKTLLFLISMLFVFSGKAQTHVEQVLVANGGIYGNPGNKITVGSYKTGTKKYTLFDSVPGNSVTQLLIDSGYLYMATDSYLVKYNLYSFARTNIVKCVQLRYIALYKNEIVATIGDDAVHLKVFKKSDLSLVYSDPKIPVFSNGITISGDSAYIALQGDYTQNYNDTGRIAVEDLANQKFKRVITLDTATRGISDMFSNATTVIGVTEYPYARFSEININTGAQKILSVGINSLSSPFAFYDDTLYTGLENYIQGFNPSNLSDYRYFKLGDGYAAAALDTLNKLFYCTGPSYTNPTKTWIYDYKGTAIDSFDIGIAPEGIAIDYELNSGINEADKMDQSLKIFPNPSSGHLNISGIDANQADINIIDMTGRILYTQTANLKAAGITVIPETELVPGIYFLSIKSTGGTVTREFVKN